MTILDRSESRDGYAVRVLAVHTSEGNDKPVVDDAAALRDASWWVGSSHAIADNDPGSLLTPAEGCVPYERASWTLRSGNRWSENIELIAQAGWTRAQWLARPTLLDRCAYWLATRSKARGIPLVKLTPQQYRAGGWGVIGHHDHTVGYSDGTHWDPGPGFPWDVVLDKARAYAAGTTSPQEDTDMAVIKSPGRPAAVIGPGYCRTLNDEEAANSGVFGQMITGNDRQYDLWVSMATAGIGGADHIAGRVWATTVFRPTPENPQQRVPALQELADSKTAAMIAAGKDVAKSVTDPAAVAEMLRPIIAEAVAAGMAADNADQADEIVDRLAARLGKPA